LSIPLGTGEKARIMRIPSLQNRTLLGESYLRRSDVSDGMPVYVVIESTSICNLKCIMCPYPSMGRENEHMSMTVYEKIVAEAAGFVEFMWLHLFGEPLANKNIYRMIDMAEEAGIRTGISTNATLMDEKACNALLDSKLSILVLCLDGATKETFERIRVGAKYEKVAANIARLGEMKRTRKSDLKVALQMIDMTGTHEERELFLQQWHGKGFDSVTVKDFHVWANQDDQLIQIAQTQTPTPAGLCYEPWIGFTVLADGTVVPCCNDYAGKMPLGDLKTQSLREIWNGDPMRALRRRFLGDKPDLQGTICEACPYATASQLEAQTGSGPFDPVRQQFGLYLGGADPMPRLAPADPHLIAMRLTLPQHQIVPGQPFACEVKVHNRSPYTLRSLGPLAVCLSYHWVEAEGPCVVYDGERTQLVPELAPGEVGTYDLRVIAPEAPGQYALLVSAVQENVAWFEDWDPRNAVACMVSVGTTEPAPCPELQSGLKG
jgi:MoaA/NifB/PqqE/SkfB family radical SAM enzyme